MSDWLGRISSSPSAVCINLAEKSRQSRPARWHFHPWRDEQVGARPRTNTDTCYTFQRMKKNDCRRKCFFLSVSRKRTLIPGFYSGDPELQLEKSNLYCITVITDTSAWPVLGSQPAQPSSAVSSCLHWQAEGKIILCLTLLLWCPCVRASDLIITLVFNPRFTEETACVSQP